MSIDRCTYDVSPSDSRLGLDIARRSLEPGEIGNLGPVSKSPLVRGDSVDSLLENFRTSAGPASWCTGSRVILHHIDRNVTESLENGRFQKLWRATSSQVPRGSNANGLAL